MYLEADEQALQEYNLENLIVQQSFEYRIGCRITALIEKSRLNRILRINRDFSNTNIESAKRGRLSEKSNELTNYELNYDESNVSVVYTCITGGYDSPKVPIVRIPNVDYVLYTDGKINQRGWISKSIHLQEELHGNSINRYHKFHPHKLFDSFDGALYIDGNVRIVSDIRPLLEIAKKSRIGIAMHKHSKRSCAYQEMRHCMKYGIGNKEKISEQIQRYTDDGFPSEFGLAEATVIAYDLTNPVSRILVDAWWKEFVNSESGRDQFALPYIIWKLGYTMDDICILGNSVYENPLFRVYQHDVKR